MLCKQKPSPAFWARSGEAAASAPRAVSDLSKRLSQLFTICVGLRGAAALVGFFGTGFRFATSAKRETLSWQLPFFTNFVCSWPKAAERDFRRIFCNQEGKPTRRGHGQTGVDDQ